MIKINMIHVENSIGVCLRVPACPSRSNLVYFVFKNFTQVSFRIYANQREASNGIAAIQF